MAKKVDICCHCGKDVGGFYVSPKGYYYITFSLIGSGSIVNHNKDDHTYRLCIDCAEKLKEITKNFFVTEADK